MLSKIIKVLATALSIGSVLVQPAFAREQIRIVGSSTVYPFSTVVAEIFGLNTDFSTPVVESTGTGGGFKLFCSGIGDNHPDFTNASRAIKSSEIELCASNGITDIIEIKIGYDGIVIANSRDSEQLSITRPQLWLALAAEIPDSNGSIVPNFHNNWSDIDPSLPNIKIEVLGPPPTSGTRDTFVELVMKEGCETFVVVTAIKDSDEDRFNQICQTVREDGSYVEAGENDVLIVRKIDANPNAFGIFGFSFLDQNSDVMQGSNIEGVASTFENVANGSYPISRPLFIYGKKDHLGVVPGFLEFINEFTDENAWGFEGYLVDRGLIPMPDEERNRYQSEARGLVVNIN